MNPAVHNLLRILDKRHLIICGGSKEERLYYGRAVMESLIDVKVYEFPQSIGHSSGFLQEARKVFSITDGSEMNLDQVIDVLLDWVEEEQSKILVWWPEFSFADEDQLTDILNHFITEKFILEDEKLALGYTGKWFRLLATSQMDLCDIHRSTRIYIGRSEDDDRKDTDIGREHLAIALLPF